MGGFFDGDTGQIFAIILIILLLVFVFSGFDW